MSLTMTRYCLYCKVTLINVLIYLASNLLISLVLTFNYHGDVDLVIYIA